MTSVPGGEAASAMRGPDQGAAAAPASAAVPLRRERRLRGPRSANAVDLVGSPRNERVSNRYFFLRAERLGIIWRALQRGKFDHHKFLAVRRRSLWWILSQRSVHPARARRPTIGVQPDDRAAAENSSPAHARPAKARSDCSRARWLKPRPMTTTESTSSRPLPSS